MQVRGLGFRVLDVSGLRALGLGWRGWGSGSPWCAVYQLVSWVKDLGLRSWDQGFRA